MTNGLLSCGGKLDATGFGGMLVDGVGFASRETGGGLDGVV